MEESDYSDYSDDFEVESATRVEISGPRSSDLPNQDQVLSIKPKPVAKNKTSYTKWKRKSELLD